MSNYKIKHVYLSDLNPELILCYKVVKKDYKKLLNFLYILKDEFSVLSNIDRKEYYYNIRTIFNNNRGKTDFNSYSDFHIQRASQLIFLNKLSYNGLYRTNNNGDFNVSYNGRKNFFKEDNIKKCSNALKNTNIKCCFYSDILPLINKDSFIYLDPPYKESNRNRVKYLYDFDDDSQKELSEFYRKLPCKALLSNSNTYNNFFYNLYDGFNIKEISVKRSFKDKNMADELLIKNY